MSQDPGCDSSEVRSGDQDVGVDRGGGAEESAESWLGSTPNSMAQQILRLPGEFHFATSWHSYQLELALSKYIMGNSGARRTRGTQMPWDQEAATRATA